MTIQKKRSSKKCSREIRIVPRYMLILMQDKELGRAPRKEIKSSPIRTEGLEYSTEKSEKSKERNALNFLKGI